MLEAAFIEACHGRPVNPASAIDVRACLFHELEAGDAAEPAIPGESR
jgi:hypothetical protein